MDVKLYVYDLSRGMARAMSRSFLGIQIDAVYHTSIVYNGIEYFFGQGMQQSIPGATHHGQPMEIIDLGKTELPPDVVLEYLESIKPVWTAESYDLFQNNCNNFSNELAQFLVGKGIPDHITSLPETVMNTPFGQMLKPQLDASMRSITQAPLAQQAAPPPQATSRSQPVAATSVNNHATKALKEHGSVYNITAKSELDRLLAEAKLGCATIFFTSSTCAPCRLAYPTFDALAANHTKAVFIKTDLNQAYDIGAAYQVRATPTFMTFLRGQKQEEWSGADPSRLKATVDALVAQAFPGHPHSNLDVPSISSGSLRPVSYTKIPPIEKLIPKLGALSSHPGASSMTAFITARNSSPSSVIPLPDLSQWTVFLTSALSTLPPDSLFAAIDLLRCTLPDARVASYFSAPATLLTSIVEHTTTQPSPPYSLRLVTLQLSSTLFLHTLSTRTIFTTPLAGLMSSLAASSLLADASRPALRAAAAALAFNLAAANYRSRREDAVELLPVEAQIELVAALAEMFDPASDPDAGVAEGAHAGALALGYLAYFAEEDGEVLDLCAAMDVKGTIGTVRAKEDKVKSVLVDLGKILPA